MARGIKDVIGRFFTRRVKIGAVPGGPANSGARAVGGIDPAPPDRPVDRHPIHRLEHLTPIARSTEERIAIACRCRDADVLPKAEGAGQVFTQTDGPDVQLMFNGVRVVAGGYYGEWMQRLIKTCHGHHEPQEEVMFAEVLRHLGPNACMVELGGYWSFYSIWFLQGSLGRTSIVVEPDPVYLETGRVNAGLNGCAPTFVNAFAGRDWAPSVPFSTESTGMLDLPRVSVPHLLETHEIGHLDLLHCDAQGAELAVLESIADLVAAARIGWIVVSTHSHHISGDPLTHQRCLALLQHYGATIVAEHDVHESFSGDGLIVARFGTVPPDWQPPKISHNRYSESLFRNPLYDLAAKA